MEQGNETSTRIIWGLQYKTIFLDTKKNRIITLKMTKT